jgi:hypothetical protein
MRELMEDRLTRAALASGAMTIMMPLVCGGFTMAVIPHSLIASVLGFVMLPMSVLAGLLLWQGFALEDFLHDAVCVLYLDRFHTLRRVYDPTVGLSTLAFVPASGIVCGVCGFLAALFSERPPVATAGFYATMGMIYGIVLTGVVIYKVVPMMAHARTR